MLNTVSDPSTNQNPSSPQSSRDDLQLTNQQQQAAELTQSANVTQEQMTVPGLRVDGTTTIVKNTTSTPANVVLGHNYLNAAWLWLLVPVAIGIFLFRPQKKAVVPVIAKTEPVVAPKPKNVEPATIEPVAEAVVADAPTNVTEEPAKESKPAAKSAKKASKGKKAKASKKQK